MLAQEKYEDAVDKLLNDVLEKLDADGKADWVKWPSLANEVKAFIGFLRHKAR